MKQNSSFWCIKIHFKFKDRHYFRVKVLGKIFQSNGAKKHTVIAILLSNKTEFKLKSFKHDRIGNFIFISPKIQSWWSWNSEHPCPKCKGTHFAKIALLKLNSYIKLHTLIVRDLNTVLSPMDKSTTQKINKKRKVAISCYNSNGLTWLLRNISPTGVNKRRRPSKYVYECKETNFHNL